ncbi:MAG: hypothetical protein WDN46_07860 [Methylocella sp.]
MEISPSLPNADSVPGFFQPEVLSTYEERPGSPNIRRRCSGPKPAEGETGERRLFSFLTTQLSDVVRPIHAKAIPVLLTTPEKWDTWLGGSVDEAAPLQRPLPNEKLRIVGTGQKADERGGRFQRKAHP